MLAVDCVGDFCDFPDLKSMNKDVFQEQFHGIFRFKAILNTSHCYTECISRSLQCSAYHKHNYIMRRLYTHILII